MDIGQKLLELRKNKNLSQEEAAEKLNVSRQTISKWETNQSTPDFDKLASICELYEISANELINGTAKDTIKETELDNSEIKKKKALAIGLSIFGYFISIVWIMITIPVLRMDPIVSSAIFLLICGASTFYLVYSCIIYKTTKQKKEKEETTVLRTIESVLALVTVIIYLLISFTTMMWHISWIIWIIYALVIEIVKLIFMLGDKNEK